MRFKRIICSLIVLLTLSTSFAYADTQSGLMLLNLNTIEEEAFYKDASLMEVEIPETTKQIKSRAFADCTNLTAFYCYSRNVVIADNAFENTNNVRIFCYTGSSMDTFAKAKGMKISYFDAFEISCNTENNGCKDLPITWAVTDILPGEKVESTYLYRVFRNGTLVETSEETKNAKYVYTPTASGNYNIEVTMKNALTETTKKSDKVAVADKLYLGVFEQDNKAETADPIEWIVIHAEEDKAFLLSKYILKTESFFNPSWIKFKYCNWNGSLITIFRSSNNWYPSANSMSFKTINGERMVPQKDGKSYISNDDLTKYYHCRSWCNGTFYSGAFSDEEKTRILLTRNTNPENPNYSSIDGGPDTYDYVFFLSYEELMKYMPDVASRKTVNTPVAQSQLSKGKSVYWWLRTRGGSNVNAMCVYGSGNYNGQVWMSGSDVGHSDLGYRPAMWITVGG